MYCLNCGQQLPEGVEYCTKCGTKVSTAKLPVERAQNAVPVPNAYPPAPKPKSKAPIVVIIIAIIVIAVSAGILAVIFMGGNSGGSSSSAQAAETSSPSSAGAVAGTSSASAQSGGSSTAEGSTDASASASQASAPAANAGAESASGQAVGADPQQVETATEPEAPEPEPEPEAQAQGRPGVDAPFWGVWIGAFTQADLAQDMADDARGKGLPATVLVTTDWSNLNEDFYYVITVGVSTDESTARKLCAQAIDAGFDGAYVKYSGEHR